MKLIIGLGNPEEQYALTRHNIGFAITDTLRTTWDFPAFEHNKKFNAEISKGKFDGQEILLVKPQTFMNISGDAVRKMLEFYKVSADDLLIIHDDLDIPLGKFRVATDSSSAGHKGVQSIIDLLSTQKFKRLRVGIGQEKSADSPSRVDTHTYVLGRFTEEEFKEIKKIEKDLIEEIKKIL